MSSTIDYASYVGIKSVPAAAAFAAIYAPLAGYYIFRVFKNRCLTLFMMVLFCVVRVGGFGLRAYVASSTSAQQNKTLVMVTSIVYGVGFLGVLFSAYSLSIDRKRLSGRDDNNILSRLSGNIHLVHLTLSAAVALSIIGTIDVNSSDTSKAGTGKTLRLVSAIIFVAITGILIARCAFGLRGNASQGKFRPDEAIGEKHGNHLLLLISVVLMVREVYLVIAVNDSAKQKDELLFYVLEAVPELIAIFLFATPGLIPDKNRGEIIPTYNADTYPLNNGGAPSHYDDYAAPNQGYSTPNYAAPNQGYAPAHNY